MIEYEGEVRFDEHGNLVGASRTIVSSMAALREALLVAMPGDDIRVRPGLYLLDGQPLMTLYGGVTLSGGGMTPVPVTLPELPPQVLLSPPRRPVVGPADDVTTLAALAVEVRRIRRRGA